MLLGKAKHLPIAAAVQKSTCCTSKEYLLAILWFFCSRVRCMLPVALSSSHTQGNTMQVLKLRIICPYSHASLGLVTTCCIENDASQEGCKDSYLLTLQYSLDTIPTERWGLCPLSLKLVWLFKLNFYIENERNVTSDFWSQVIKGSIVSILLDGILLEPLVIMYAVWLPRGYALRKPNLADLRDYMRRP